MGINFFNIEVPHSNYKFNQHAGKFLCISIIDFHLFISDVFLVWVITMDLASQFGKEDLKVNVCPLCDHFQFVKEQNVNHASK